MGWSVDATQIQWLVGGGAISVRDMKAWHSIPKLRWAEGYIELSMAAK